MKKVIHKSGKYTVLIKDQYLIIKHKDYAPVEYQLKLEDEGLVLDVVPGGHSNLRAVFHCLNADELFDS